jgi:hypothetical protein
MRMRRFLTCVGLSLLAANATAEGWCDLAAGSYDLVSHGTKSDQVYLVGQLSGASTSIWMTIADSTVGKGNVALILAAEMAGKGVSVYLDSPSATCANFTSWAPIGGIRHVRILQ